MKQIINLIDSEIEEQKKSGKAIDLIYLKEAVLGLKCNCNRGKKKLYCHRCGKVLCEDCSRGIICKECEK